MLQDVLVITTYGLMMLTYDTTCQLVDFKSNCAFDAFCLKFFYYKKSI